LTGSPDFPSRLHRQKFKKFGVVTSVDQSAGRQRLEAVGSCTIKQFLRASPAQTLITFGSIHGIVQEGTGRLRAKTGSLYYASPKNLQKESLMNIPIPPEAPDPNIDDPSLPVPPPDEEPPPTMPPVIEPPVGDPPAQEQPVIL
jgi:hypothetical protein